MFFTLLYCYEYYTPAILFLICVFVIIILIASDKEKRNEEFYDEERRIEYLIFFLYKIS